MGTAITLLKMASLLTGAMIKLRLLATAINSTQKPNAKLEGLETTVNGAGRQFCFVREH